MSVLQLTRAGRPSLSRSSSPRRFSIERLKPNDVAPNCETPRYDEYETASRGTELVGPGRGRGGRWGPATHRQTPDVESRRRARISGRERLALAQKPSPGAGPLTSIPHVLRASLLGCASSIPTTARTVGSNESLSRPLHVADARLGADHGRPLVRAALRTCASPSAGCYHLGDAHEVAHRQTMPTSRRVETAGIACHPGCSVTVFRKTLPGGRARLPDVYPLFVFGSAVLPSDSLRPCDASDRRLPAIRSWTGRAWLDSDCAQKIQKPRRRRSPPRPVPTPTLCRPNLPAASATVSDCDAPWNHRTASLDVGDRCALPSVCR